MPGTDVREEFEEQPFAPMLPVLSLRGWSLTGPGERLATIGDAKHTCRLSSGSAAIALALRHAGISAQDSVLLPAYRCPSMIEPIWLNRAEGVSYRVKADLTIDVDDVQSKLDGTVKAVLAPHYFGFSQNMQALKAICARGNVLLIEDCAHSFFATDGQVGKYGDYVIASVRKFFPVADGGLLASDRADLGSLKLESPSLVRQLKLLFNQLEEAVAYGRLRWLRPLLGLANRTRRTYKSRKRSSATVGNTDDNDAGNEYLDPHEVATRASLSCGLVLRYYSTSYAIRRRRENYAFLLQRLSHMRECTPLFGPLDEHTVPYVFPLILATPEDAFVQLKKSRLPMYRWEESDAQACETAAHYARALIQIPCHEQLLDTELEQIVSRIRAALS